MGKLLDEQIREAKKNGATPVQIRELEQAKIETINQLKADLAEAAHQKNQPASPPEKDEPDPNETMLAAFKKRVSQPDTMPASLIYDEEPGRYSDLPASFRFIPKVNCRPVSFRRLCSKNLALPCAKRAAMILVSSKPSGTSNYTRAT